MNPTDCQHFSTIDKINYHFSTKTLFQKMQILLLVTILPRYTYIVLRKPGGTKIAFSFYFVPQKRKGGVLMAIEILILITAAPKR